MLLSDDDIKYGIPFGGSVLDGCPAEYLTWDNINDICTILAYRYEDGKWWHDQTCVMEIIFYSYQDNIENDRVRILFLFPTDLLYMLTKIMQNHTCFIRSVKIDLGGYCVNPEEDGEYINKQDFDKFDCSIQHKKHFHLGNPEMPDD